MSERAPGPRRRPRAAPAGDVRRRGTPRLLGPRALNRALLARQMLLRRRRVAMLAAVERLVGLQAQVPRDPYVALWSRLDRFGPEALAEAVADRGAVRMTLLRGTLHLVTADDAVALRPALQGVMERIASGSSPLRTVREDVDLAALLAYVRAFLEERPRSRAELVRATGERWPDQDADALAYAMYLVPTVQVTPRGIWGRTGRAAFATVERWLGRPLEPDRAPDGLVLRYLAAFGPATPADVRTWSGLPGDARGAGAAPARPPDVPGRAGPGAVRRAGRAAPGGRHAGPGPLPPGVRQRVPRARRQVPGRPLRHAAVDGRRVGAGARGRVRGRPVEAGGRGRRDRAAGRAVPPPDGGRRGRGGEGPPGGVPRGHYAVGRERPVDGR